jgi:hypothetical protein
MSVHAEHQSRIGICVYDFRTEALPIIVTFRVMLYPRRQACGEILACHAYQLRTPMKGATSFLGYLFCQLAVAASALPASPCHFRSLK